MTLISTNLISCHSLIWHKALFQSQYYWNVINEPLIWFSGSSIKLSPISAWTLAISAEVYLYGSNRPAHVNITHLPNSSRPGNGTRYLKKASKYQYSRVMYWSFRNSRAKFFPTNPSRNPGKIVCFFSKKYIEIPNPTPNNWVELKIKINFWSSSRLIINLQGWLWHTQANPWSSHCSALNKISKITSKILLVGYYRS